MKKSTLRRFVSIILALTMMLSLMIPAVTASAASSEKDARDFFKYVGDEGKNALEVLNKAKGVKSGSTSATNLTNMYAALELAEQVNTYRKQEGKSALKVSHTGMAMAMANADWSASQSNLKHSGQFGLDSYGYGYSTRGENLAWAKNAAKAAKAWYAEKQNLSNGKETGHYENMVNSKFTECGVGLSKINYASHSNNYTYCQVYQDTSKKENGTYSVSNYKKKLKAYMDSVGVSTSFQDNASMQKDGLEYKVTNTSKKYVTVVRATSSTSIKKILVPDTVTLNGTTYTVTAIGASAFENYNNVPTLAIYAEHLTSVGKNAIKGMKSDLEIKVPKSKGDDYKKLFCNSKTGWKSTMKYTPVKWK